MIQVFSAIFFIARGYPGCKVTGMGEMAGARFLEVKPAKEVAWTSWALMLCRIENRVLWAGQISSGSASNHTAGMMESWSVGIMGLAESYHFFQSMR